jgi:hypothetical protein
VLGAFVVLILIAHHFFIILISKKLSNTFMLTASTGLVAGPSNWNKIQKSDTQLMQWLKQ